MPGVGRPRAECLLQESDADALGAPRLLQGGRDPGLALDHLGEQGQPDRDDLAVPRQAGGDRVQEPRLLGGRAGRARGQLAEGLPESRQDVPGVVDVEEVERGEVVPLHDRDVERRP